MRMESTSALPIHSSVGNDCEKRMIEVDLIDISISYEMHMENNGGGREKFHRMYSLHRKDHGDMSEPADGIRLLPSVA